MPETPEASHAPTAFSPSQLRAKPYREAMTNTEPLRIVLGVDFEKPSDAALELALTLLRNAPHSELHAAHVIYEPNATRGERILRDDKLLDAAYTGLREYVEGHAPKVDAAEWEQTVHFHARLGAPAASLFQIAVDVNADMIVVGTAGLKGLEKLLLGSVAEELVKMGRIPVLVAKPKNFEGWTKSPVAEEAKPGADASGLHDGFRSSGRVMFGRRNAHISGLL